MGLDLASRAGSIRISSYGGVHAQRVVLINAFASTGKPEREMVSGWIESEELPDYDTIPREEADLVAHLYKDTNDGVVLRPSAQALIGLWKYVNHSDCDGFHSPGDVEDIIAMLDYLYLPDNLGWQYEEWAGDWLESIARTRNFFLDSRGGFIEYC